MFPMTLPSNTLSASLLMKYNSPLFTTNIGELQYRTLGLLSAGCHLKDSSDRAKGRVLTYKLEKLEGFYGDLDESGICNRLCDHSFNIEADEVSQSRAQEQIFISGRRYISGICIHASAA